MAPPPEIQQVGIGLRVLFPSRSHPLPKQPAADWATLCKPPEGRPQKSPTLVAFHECPVKCLSLPDPLCRPCPQGPLLLLTCMPIPHPQPQAKIQNRLHALGNSKGQHHQLRVPGQPPISLCILLGARPESLLLKRKTHIPVLPGPASQAGFAGKW